MARTWRGRNHGTSAGGPEAGVAVHESTRPLGRETVGSSAPGVSRAGGERWADSRSGAAAGLRHTAEEVEAAKRGWMQGREVARATDQQLAMQVQNGLFLGRTMAWDAAYEAAVRAVGHGAGGRAGPKRPPLTDPLRR